LTVSFLGKLVTLSLAASDDEVANKVLPGAEKHLSVE
jgi:hypothetical protein